MFSEYLDLFRAYMESNNNSPSTIEQYTREMKKFFAFLEERKIMDIREVEAIHIDMYQASLMKVNKSASVAKKMYVLKSFFKYLVSRKYIGESPMASMETVKIKQSDRKKKENLSEEEALRFLASVERHSIPSMKLRNKVLMMAFLFFGLRVSELCSLRTKDVSYKDKTVYIWDGKGGKNREVPIFDELIEPLKTYMKSKRTNSDYFFTTKNTDRPMQPRAVLNLVKHHAKKARIKKNIGCHSLRRTAATLLLDDGVDPRRIQMYLGHSSINTTMLYLNPDIEETKEVIRNSYGLAKKLKKQNKKKE